ncbi:pyridoxamine 5'-phosphate oxidase family protein [Nocardioides sp. BP30]|uniref:pyridoxamine 5'-phosphate oxidase family protein n=1 Tax=Nocardioides sp. BP30 TaxID=3036374 RepID=UPI002468830D|nr:pyridoxamine 5'-phosphate oxidase family protein [Nocardioides sp. BP30]WGL51119.1 pyridoxamine 5'-phosphate oxidase family protein [Nocardioides sp. BP30]
MGRHLVDLTEAECWERLETRDLARIAWNTSAGPEILPVNYVTHDGALWMRTTAHSSIAEQTDESPVAVEIDDLDPGTHVGWSVVLRGRAEAFYHDEDVPAEVKELRSWAAGVRPLWLQVKADVITGKSLSED